jgi:hypothetical protein
VRKILTIGTQFFLHFRKPGCVFRILSKVVLLAGIFSQVIKLVIIIVSRKLFIGIVANPSEVAVAD